VTGRVVAFDLGDKRIGVAVSDPLGTLALGRPTLERSGGSWPWRAILEVMAEVEAVRVVVGDPLQMDGRVGTRAEISRRFAEEIGQRTGLPVDLQDERLTSVQAERGLRASGGGAGGKGRRGEVDRSAAVLILQTWLDRRAARAARGEAEA
jgi:putative Holliday junction resolvase